MSRLLGLVCGVMLVSTIEALWKQRLHVDDSLDANVVGETPPAAYITPLLEQGKIADAQNLTRVSNIPGWDTESHAMHR